MAWLFLPVAALAWGPQVQPLRPVPAWCVTPLACTSVLMMVDEQGRVTREEAETAIEMAEALAAEALQARQEANELADEAERKSLLAADESEGAASQLDRADKFGLSLLSASTMAQRTSLDAGALIAEAVEASERADQLDVESASALAQAEELIAQHYEDFPDSDA